MIIKALYDNEPCFLNTDYVVDIFKDGKGYIAYVLDVERKGYHISKEDVERLIKDEVTE